MASVEMADIERLKKHCLEFNVLESMHSDLCNALPIDDLFPGMISNHVIDFRDKEDICMENRTERGRVQYFLVKYLYPPLLLMDTTRFYQFLTVMKRSPKCDFLVRRINHWMEQYKNYSAKPGGQSIVEGQSDKFPLAPSPPPPSAVTTATTTTATKPSTSATKTAASVVAHARVSTTAVSPGNVPIGCNDCLVTGKASQSCMKLMHKLIIPKISEEWEAVATFLDYSIQAKNNIRETYRTSHDCCVALIEDWLSTDNGLQPKTWKSLIEALGEIEELESEVKEIKQCLVSEGVSFDVVPVEDSHDYNQEYVEETNAQGAAAGMQFHPQHYPYDQYTDPTATHFDQYGRPVPVPPTHNRHPHDPRWNQQPAPNQMWRNEQFGQHNHPSYDPSSTHLDQYGRPVVTNPVPPTYNKQPHAAGVDQYGTPMIDNQAVPPTEHRSPHPGSAFIVYSKEENDPHGDQVLCLSNLLCNCGINCNIDLYHINENIMDWSFWVGKSLEYHIASRYSYIILVCSPVMISTLEERNDNARLQMVAGYIDRLTLRHYLEQGAQRVLPLFINNPAAEYVPPSLSGKTRYHFPYDKLNEMAEDVSPHEVLNDPDFASLRSLVATLTGQQEFPPPDLGHVPQVRNSSNMTSSAPHPMFPGTETATQSTTYN